MTRRAALVVLLAALAACSSSSAGPDAGDRYAGATRVEVPPALAGLSTTLEKDASKQLSTEGGRRSYVSEGWVYALRQGEELKAVLEVARLDPDARPADRRFRRTIVGQIGGKVNRPERVGGVPVYEGSLNEQRVFMWFRGRFLQVLMVREDETVEGEGVGFDARRLVEEAVALEPR